MCRISGIINGRLPVADLETMVNGMCSLMKHGGPDDGGVFADQEHHLVLGNRRLSLIDLSHGGHQPMEYESGRYVITFNGEIYNYKELKEELLIAGHSFRTGSDTEVILAAFAAWGTAAFDRLNGMFAFALWDSLVKKLYLVRDASGIKPLYYAHTKEGLAFSSEIKGFQPIPYLHEENKHWPVYLMAYGFLPEPVTTLQQVQPVSKGTYICYNVITGVLTAHGYKKYHFSGQLTDRGAIRNRIKETLLQAVTRHLIADAPTGVFLSGGIDSGILALLANRSVPDGLNTLSLYVDHPRFSEKKYQDILFRQLNCCNNQFLLQEQEFHDNLPAVLKAMDQPSSDGINTWFISKYARQNGLKAVLSGIGADEMYGGYPSFDRVRRMLFLEKLPGALLRTGRYTRLKKLRRMGYLSLGGTVGKYLFLRGQFVPFEIAEQLNMDETEVWNILQTTPQYEDLNQEIPFNQVSWMEANIYMQSQLLRDADFMSMAHGVEIRVPYLDKEFIELSMQIKSSVKYGGDVPKQLLIDSFKDILPEAIWNRPKMGFSFPFQEWLSRDEFIKDSMSAEKSNYTRFISGHMHWSHFLTLVHLKNRLFES